MTTTIGNGATSPRALDSSRVRARHIVRAPSSTPGARQVLPGQWWAPAAGSIEGPQGWQGATVERRVNDHGTMQGLALPNGAGSDGQMHRDRFAVRTDPEYRMGSEWIELTDDDSGRPLAVTTPDSARVDRTAVSLSGVDAAGLLSGFREGRVAPWTPHAPQDVVDWYSRAPQARVSTVFASSPASLHGWSVNGGTPVATIEGVRLPAGAAIARYEDGPHINNYPGRSLRATLRLDDTAGLSLVTFTWSGQELYVRPQGSNQWGLSMTVREATGPTSGTIREFACSPVPRSQRDTIEVEMFVRDGWCIVTMDGQVAAQVRHDVGHYDAGGVRIGVGGSGSAAVTVREVYVSAMVPLLRRAAPATDYRVAGAPTPGGLRGDYFLEADAWARASTQFSPYGHFWATAMAPLAEPYQRRLDTSMDFNGATWMPPGPSGGRRFAVRWSGSIYLPLAERDVWCGLYGAGGGIVGMVRVWIGSTRSDRPYQSLTWAGEAQADAVGGSLRSHLGSTASGWYPVVIEYAVGATSANPRIRFTRSTGAGPNTQLIADASILSPYGCWEGDLGGESHREAIDGVCAPMGLRWRVQPKTLESGEFPGRLEVAARLGTDTDYTLGEDEATEYASELAAGETVDQIVADAAGLGDTLGREGLSASMVDPDAVGRPWVMSRYEQLGEISEETMLRQRMSSLLALHGSPVETVAARPRGQEALTDTFPVTGAARLFTWEPDDGIRLSLPTIGVEDLTPRAITSVTWPLTPDGRGAPSVGFRQRPKHLRAALQRLLRQSMTARRRYQGQLAQITGSFGSTTTASAPDGHSRIGLPVGEVVKVELRVITLNGAGTIEVLGANTGIAAGSTGTYDVTAWVPAGLTYGYARLVGAASYTIQLVATIRV